ncbi:MAG: aldo/keto reductase, partial [Desulfurococcales archaeon]|nr:aldo/keto reductase [Desulfurococcales archaeon]
MYEIDYRDAKPLGKTGEKIPALGLGTWDIRDYPSALEVYVEAVNVGLSMIDTAEMYGDGKAEEFVGKVIRRVGRDSVFIITKMLPHNTKSRDRVIKAGKAALRRLGIDCVDLYLIHWPCSAVSIEEQIRNFEALIDEGIARYVGVSNFDADELETALNAMRKGEIVLDQVHY